MPWTMILVPESGLFFDKGKFTDGQGKEVPWDGGMLIFNRLPDAEKWKQKRIESGKDAAQSYRIVPLEFIGTKPQIVGDK